MGIQLFDRNVLSLTSSYEKSEPFFVADDIRVCLVGLL